MVTLRRVIVIGAIAALVGGVGLITTVGAAGGQDVTHYTVSCDTMTKGEMSFVPPLLFGGVRPSMTKIKGTLSGCTATPDGSNPAVTVVSGIVSGALSTPTNDCVSLLNPSAVTGTITIKWKTVPAITPNTTTITIASGNISVGANLLFGGPAAYFGINISGAAVTGGFLGADSGASSVFNSLFVQGTEAVVSSCSIRGLKAINLGPTAISLG